MKTERAVEHYEMTSNNNNGPMLFKYLSDKLNKQKRKEYFRTKFWPVVGGGVAALEAPPLGLYENKYRVQEDGMKLYPLSLICVKEPSLEWVEAVYKGFPKAISDNDNEHGVLPLHIACRYGASFEIIKYLVDKYPRGVEEIDENGNLPLHYACGNQLHWNQDNDNDAAQRQQKEPNLQILRYLISAGPDTVKVQNDFGWLPLHFLCANKSPTFPTTRFLLSRYPGAAEITTHSGYRPEQLVKQEEQSDVVQLLRYAKKNLRDTHKSFALPLSRFALEWEISHNQLVAEKNKEEREAAEAEDLLQRVLLPLREYYPSRCELERFIREEQQENDLWDIADKRAAINRMNSEILDAKKIPVETSERLKALEASSDHDDTTTRDIRFIVDKEILAKHGLPCDDHDEKHDQDLQDSEHTTVTSDTSGDDDNSSDNAGPDGIPCCSE